MPTSKQRREAARRHLERQLQRRQQREQARRRFTLIASIVGTLVLIAVILLVVLTTTGHSKKKTASSASSTPTSSASATPTPTPTPSTSYPAAAGAAVSFDGVTVKGATDLKGVPAVTSKSSTTPTKLLYKDLVVGKGAVASPSATVTVQYIGLLYKNGVKFDASWDRGSPAQFSLAQVVPGFTQGIGGTTGVPPMHVGGRRIMILPASLGYGSQANGAIPANSPLVFVVDLTKVG